MSNDLTVGSPIKLIFNFTIPMLLGNIFQQFYSIANMIIVGQLVGKDALAAIGTSVSVLFMMNAIVFGLTIGASVIISQYYGAGEFEKVRTAVSTLFIFMLISGAVFSIIGILLSNPIMKVLQTPEDIMDSAVLYFNILMGGCVSTFLYTSMAAVFRALGDSKTPLYFLIASSVLNIALDILLVGGMGIGVAGAAIATVISQIVSFILCVVYIYYKVDILRFNRKEIKFNRNIAKLFIKYGIPSSIQQSLVSISAVSVQGLTNSFGPVVMAAYAAASKIDALATVPIMNFGSALSTYVGQNVGKRKPERVKTGLRATLILSIGLCLVTSAVILIFKNYFMAAFVSADEVDVIRCGAEYMSIIAMFFFLFAFQFTFHGLLRGAGDVNYVMILSIITLVIRTGFAYLLAHKIGYLGIVWSLPISWSIVSFIGFMRYRSGKWKSRGIYGAL